MLCHPHLERYGAHLVGLASGFAHRLHPLKFTAAAVT
jgi:hypothetical protein